MKTRKAKRGPVTEGRKKRRKEKPIKATKGPKAPNATWGQSEKAWGDSDD